MDETPKVLMIGPAFSGGGAEGRFSRIAGLVAHGTADIAVLVLPQGAQAPGQGALIDLGWRGRGSWRGGTVIRPRSSAPMPGHA